MFERLTKDARDVVRGAAEHAEGAGARSVEAEHVLLALLDGEASRASFGLAALGLTERKDSVRQALTESRRRAGLSQAEADALAGLGIDVSEIVARVEEVHGVGAMSGDRKDKGWWSGRRTFGRDAKEVLERSLRIAVARRDRHVGDEHILLALTACPGVPAEILADHGVTYETLTRVLYGGGEAQAG
ncbi:Clp protease N-terminal domain-containing protein [Streptomyces resistomycificus]|uniref:Peptidase n=1 Tax=Streptomyces resistomycificus TaxID=67356 RepID=A0A0L8LJC6_9ACTN|nr:Clp protease N-terminal domain-containing protein [Streptomyces resistomycificus]KOG38171.1 peptidase [Streptomyces resistomycificus]KUN98742.1 peptidase [Streptomyces resistomycificus]